jgi:hypothetical protein
MLRKSDEGVALKHSQALVCQYLENICRTVLEKHQVIIRAYVWNRHGIYALYRKGCLYYVGLASDLCNRLQCHLTDRHAKSWDRFSVYLTVEHDKIRELESLMLRIVGPSGNKQTGRFVNAENLGRRFKKDIRDMHRMELNDLIGPHGIKARGHLSNGNGSKVHWPPILSEYVSQPMVLKGRVKGRVVHARVLKDGGIQFKGRTYNSPTLAATAARGFPFNGWLFWSFEREPGDWAILDTLR